MRYKGNILEVNNLSLSIVNGSDAPSRILNNLTFKVRTGEILGLIGNSGSGKTMTALAVSGLLSEASVIDSGEILLEGEDLVQKSPAQRR